MKKFGLVDLIIVLGVIIALAVGVYTAKHFRQTADKQIEATSPITFQVFLSQDRHLLRWQKII